MSRLWRNLKPIPHQSVETIEASIYTSNTTRLGIQRAIKTGGHATSSDLIHWKNASPFIAIASDPAEVYAIRAKDFPAKGISPGAEE
jgi:hypothetical protein